MDIVYCVSQGAGTDLMFSIRSMFKHLAGIEHIVIVGHRPAFLKKCIHIEHPDVHKDNIARNIYEKIRAACLDDRVSDPFLLAFDDHFLLQSYEIEKYPVFRNAKYQWLQELHDVLTSKNYYKPYVAATIAALQAKQMPTMNYNVHCPIILAKDRFLDVMEGFDWTGKKGFIAKSTYCNALWMRAIPIGEKKMYNPQSTARGIMSWLDGHPFFSINENAMNDQMLKVLNELYPAPSPCE